MDLQREKESLIEAFGQHFESIYRVPPLASRIMATMIVDYRPGITFDAIVERMHASKSTVSTSLNLLLKLGKIQYYTLPGDRRKHYRPAPFSKRLQKYQEILAFECDILDRMTVYREKTMTAPHEAIDLENIHSYREHIVKVSALLDKTIEKFKKTEQKN